MIYSFSKKYIVLLFLIFVMSSLCDAKASQITSFYDNFDSDNNGVQGNFTTGFDGWNVTSGNVDLIGNGVWDNYPGNGLYIDLAGTQFGELTTKDFFAPGAYDVIIEAMGTRLSDESDGYYVKFGQNFYNSPLGTFGTHLNIHEIWTISADSQLSIGDSGRSGSRYSGATLMSVSVQKHYPVPEPSTFALTAVALAGLASVVVRRRKAAR